MVESDQENDFYEDEEFFDNPEEIEEFEEEEEEQVPEQEQEQETADKLEQRKLQKQEKLKRKLLKPNSDLILKAKQIWEELRKKRLKKAERIELMEEMMKIVQGKALDVT